MEQGVLKYEENALSTWLYLCLTFSTWLILHIWQMSWTWLALYFLGLTVNLCTDFPNRESYKISGKLRTDFSAYLTLSLSLIVFPLSDIAHFMLATQFFKLLPWNTYLSSRNIGENKIIIIISKIRILIICGEEEDMRDTKVLLRWFFITVNVISVMAPPICLLPNPWNLWMY